MLVCGIDLMCSYILFLEKYAHIGNKWSVLTLNRVSSAF